MKNAAMKNTKNSTNNTINLSIEDVLRQLQENLGLNIAIDDNGKLVLNDQPRQSVKNEPAPAAVADNAPVIKAEPSTAAKAEPTAKAITVPMKVNASVAGTTFINKGNKYSGQRVMALLKTLGCRHIVRLEQTTFGDDPALRVWVFPATQNGKLVDGKGPANKAGYPVGYIAAKNGDLAKVLTMVDAIGGTKSLKINSTIVGGNKLANGEQLNFGMRLVISR